MGNITIQHMDHSINNNKSFNLLDATEQGIAIIMHITSTFISNPNYSCEHNIITSIENDNKKIAW